MEFVFPSRHTNIHADELAHLVGAKLPHLLKYTDGYDQLYPSATQILIRSEVTTFFKPDWMRANSPQTSTIIHF